ncbi:MAG: transcriptional regulator, partial [Bacteroidales bacterium]|nr:transcriptional regulator [Bacteroidales bacterium]
MLSLPHTSIPANPVLANPLYLAGYIERLGTGTSDMVDECVSIGLKAPEFIQDSNFRSILWRKDAPTSEKNALTQGKNAPTSEKNALTQG